MQSTCLVFGVLLLGAGQGRATQVPADSAAASETTNAPALTDPSASQAIGHFIANRGQFKTPAAFVGTYPGMLVRAERNALLLQCQPQGRAQDGVLVRWSFPGSSADVAVEGLDRLPVVYSYFRGAEPESWHRDVGAFSQVRYRGLYHGIDLVVRTEDGHPKYDVLVAAGADLATFVVRYEGAAHGSIEADGSLVFATAAGPLRQPSALAWEQRTDGARRDLTCRFRIVGEDSFGFEVTDRDPAAALVVDPGIFWSTYLGGAGTGTSSGDQGKAVAFGPDGSVTAVGEIESADFPQTPGTFTTPGVLSGEIFVTRLSGPKGALVYSAIIAGTSGFQDRGRRVAVDALGRATVAGYADSVDFPTTPGAWDRVKDGPFDAFVLRLNADGSDLEYSSFLGAAGGELAEALVLAPNGSAIVGGYTGGSTQFPTTPGAYDTVYELQGQVGFITRFTPDGSGLEWSTLLGLGGTDVLGLALDANQDVVATGRAGNEVVFPTSPGAWVSYVDATENTFVCRLSADGSTLLWSSLFGGNGADRPFDVAVIPGGGVVVAGTAQNFSTFPTTAGVVQSQAIPSFSTANAFVVRLLPDGSAPVYSTLLGLGFDGAKGMAADASGVVTIAGAAWAGFGPPTPGAHDSVNTRDIGITRLNPTGTKVLYSTSLGGLGDDDCNGMAMTATGRVAVVGETTGDYPTTSGAAQQTAPGGQTDALVSVLDLIPTGVRAFGRSTASCRGPLVLNAFAKPSQGAADFSLYASGLPPNTNARVLVSDARLISAESNSGVNLWVDVTSRLKRVPVTSSADGYLEVSIPALVAGLPGSQLFVQLVADGTAACGGLGTRCASNGLEITVQ